MRSRVGIIIITILLCLVGTAAAVALTQGMQRGTSVAASINGEVIYASDVAREVDAVARQYGIDLNSEQGRSQRTEISRIVLDQLLEQRLILQEARKRGAVATDTQIDEALAEIRANFPSDSEFQFALSQRGLTLSDLRERLRTNITVQNLQSKVSKATVSEEEIKKFYEANRKDFDQPEQVRVRHILVETEAEARFVLARLNRGEKFQDLARTLSKDPGSRDNNGELPLIGRGQLVPEFERVAFTLQPGEVSDVVKTQFGYHIIQVIERRNAQPSNLDQVREQIRRQLLSKKQESDFTAWLKLAKTQAVVKRADTPPK